MTQEQVKAFGGCFVEAPRSPGFRGDWKELSDHGFLGGVFEELQL